MSNHARVKMEFAKEVLEKTAEALHKKYQKTKPARKKWIKKIHQKAAKRRAKKLNIESISEVGIEIRKKINERIIQEVKRRKLRHADVSSISLVPRTRITSMMNRKLKSISIDLLIRVLESLGVPAYITFD